MKADWYISYRFTDGTGKTKQIIAKGMNAYKTWPERKDATRDVMRDDDEDLKAGYNPITDAYTVIETPAEVGPETPLATALEFAGGTVTCGESIKKDLRSVLRNLAPALEDIKMARLPVGQVTRKHVKRLLAKLWENRPDWTGNAFNYYRSRLSIIFQELMEYEAIEFDPAALLKKKKYVKKIRKTLQDEERVRVKEHLDKVHPDFSRVMQIFFHSGIRGTEMLRIRTEDVELAKERFKVTVLKGGQYVEQWRVIKQVALTLWKQQLTKAKPGDYLFSEGAVPRKKQMTDGYLTDLWYHYVKREPKAGDKRKYLGIGIKSDFYALKHLHSTEAMDILEEIVLRPAEEVAGHNGHRSTAMLEKHYDTKADGRKGKLVKMLQNEFVKKAAD